jgi:hypothetical protein
MWRRANLQRWIAAFRMHPGMGLTGFAVGMLYGVATTLLNHLNGHRASPSMGILAWLNVSPIVTALIGIAIFIWLAGTLRLPQKRGVVFVVCILPGALVELLLSAIFRAMA